jgi:glutamate-1-semialdehyde 2,1-aminomutase
VRATVVRVGSLLTVFFADRPPRSLTEVEAMDRVRFRRFHAGLTARGVLIPPSPFEAWFISAAHAGSDVDDTAAAAHAAFAAAAESAD